ncbi:MAG: cytochrome bc complex cytochrome b subunit [Nitrospirota bacterium]|jgi:ubiquinol-cytochrome c reductase cytochrome b subunit
MLERIRGYLESRIGIEAMTSRLKHYRLPKGTNVLSTLGFVVLAALVVQAVTGILLLMYYIPHPDFAFKSIQSIMNTVPFGWLFRQMHIVGSNLIVGALFIHLVYTFMRGGYKWPRELTWVTGALLMLLVLTASVTGYLLPWHQLSYWATTVATSIPSVIPVVGDSIVSFVRGGDYVSGITLGRFFAFHVAFIPTLLFVFVLIHAYLVVRIGYSCGLEGECEDMPLIQYQRDPHPDGISLYPDFFIRQLYMTMVYFVIVFFVITFMPSTFLPAGANEQANPFLTPPSIRPQWFFLAPYQLVKIIPSEFIGGIIHVIFMVVFLFWPFFDSKRERRLSHRPFLLGVFLASIVLWFILTIWGAR